MLNKKLMAYQSYLRTNFIPMRYPVNGTSNTPTPTPTPTPSYTLENVCIGGGIMTVRRPVTTPTYTPNPFSVPQTAHVALASISHSPLPSSRWASAGSIIIEENYRRRNGSICQAIVLGYNPHKRVYELFYGKRDSGDQDPIMTAMRETREETGNMFSLPYHAFNDNFSVSSFNDQHHAYVIRVRAPPGGIQSKVFSSNQRILGMNGASHCWRELSNITRIDINEAISFGILRYTSGVFTMTDVYGNSIVIHKRDTEFIRDMILKSLHVSSPIYQLRYISSFRSLSQPFLNGSQSYTV